AVWHKDQHRKYPGTLVPYMSHVAGVAAILSRHGFGEGVVAAGGPPRGMGGCGAPDEKRSGKFGERGADLVRHMGGEGKVLPWEERKRLHLEHFSHKPWEAKAITLADKIDNFQSILVCARTMGDPWAMFKRGREAQIGRFQDLKARAEQITPPHPLVAEYART